MSLSMFLEYSVCVCVFLSISSPSSKLDPNPSPYRPDIPIVTYYISYFTSPEVK